MRTPGLAVGGSALEFSTARPCGQALVQHTVLKIELTSISIRDPRTGNRPLWSDDTNQLPTAHIAMKSSLLELHFAQMTIDSVRQLS